MKNISIITTLIISIHISYSQAYKTAFRAEMCDCLTTESLKRPLSENTYKTCFRETLPKFANQIDALIIEEDLNQKYLLGQIARRDLIVEIQPELVYTCTTYFEYLERGKLSKKLIAQESINESALEAQNQYVAMSPNAYAYFSRAQLHYNLGNLAESEADIRKSLEVNPNSDNPKSTRNELLLLALIYEENQQYEKAIAIYDQVYMGVYDSGTAILRALADKKNGGTISNIPKFSEDKLSSVNSNSRRNGRAARSGKNKEAGQQNAKAKARNEKNRSKKKSDTSALKKLFKIDN
ncbi:tetratricopeptide repeat protein [Psychroserpens algicola]|uniref:tetratricopeptide repeat protein n=1 Tax=Psychroserpens algicola TaxID=1719034 RepID=UPI0019542EC2|nr:tetratricopeptide repeat protein [Psychroserpens algicola]